MECSYENTHPSPMRMNSLWLISLFFLFANCSDPNSSSSEDPNMMLGGESETQMGGQDQENINQQGGMEQMGGEQIGGEQMGGEQMGGEMMGGEMTEEDFQSPLPANQTFPECQQSYVQSGLLNQQDLYIKALKFDRVFEAISARGHGLNADLGLRNEDAKQQVIEFTQGSAQTLEEAGLNPDDLVQSYSKAAGLYGGVGLAADAYRYIALRNQGAACDELERARVAVRRGLEILHLAETITGVEGVLPRALALKDLPGAGQSETLPLFDEEGNPFPTEKTNGTWRTDQSGQYPGYIWEDSCSRDMYVGWILAYGALWEAIAHDSHFTEDEKQNLRQSAHRLMESLKVVREDGYDLEIRDSDGRRTYHGMLNENSVDRIYVMGAPNAFNALMATGIVSALTAVSGFESDRLYLQETLIEQRDLLNFTYEYLYLFDFGPGTNYSGYNMAFISAWLLSRYAPDENALFGAQKITRRLYQNGDKERQPSEQSQALYDLVYVGSMLGQRWDGSSSQFEETPEIQMWPIVLSIDEILEKIGTILREFPGPPFLGSSIIHCDEEEVASKECYTEDGTYLPLLGAVGWNDEVVSAVPVPMRLRPASNFYWRSNPYSVNGGQGDLSLLPANDFRFVYWLSQVLIR